MKKITFVFQNSLDVHKKQTIHTSSNVLWLCNQKINRVGEAIDFGNEQINCHGER
jgi:hypothetical protein